MTTVTVSDRPAGAAKADALVLASVKTDGGAELAAGHGLSKKAAAHVNAALRNTQAGGSPDELVRLSDVPEVAAPLVVVSGLGAAPEKSGFTAETLRRAAGAATRSLSGSAKVSVRFPGSDAALVGAVAEGALFGAYAFLEHRGESAKRAKAPVKAVIVHTDGAKDRGVKAAVKRAGVLAGHQNYARDLVNTAPNLLYPQTFAESVRARAAGTAVSVRVMDEKALAKAGCGGILGVGQGSARPPRIVTLTYKPAKARASLAYIGKGITFDSGGLCLKPGASMVTMKCDMAGAAAVAAAIFTIAELGLPVAVTGYLCLAENMTGSNAQRPGDVVTMRGGKTVEIINTDAEGRLVMGDGLALASEKQPDAIVDIATLTGAAVMALGHRTSAVMANDDDLRERVHAVATGAGESMWQMPLVEEVRSGMDSTVADFKHTGDRVGGMMVAATFLSEFIGKDKAGRLIPWAHLDIAGPAFNESAAFGYTPKGGTGYGVRTLVGLAEDHAAK
ncbi:leucyl aminopeptidase [Segeticoccus rhizosphaerae]|uniref:leucyl aminopeptidase n=1 Tax=Segeticoccus rhizosphaerae TaxID=1104777 RepID=UPI00126558D0|nr:leucyl aminopeptidase [Segeticoccus rhizosphaerae]